MLVLLPLRCWGMRDGLGRKRGLDVLWRLASLVGASSSRERFKKLLGLDVPDDARGCLQDIHWAFGGLGYFPTYTLGNLYAAQFFEAARQAVGDLDEMFARGEFLPLRDWLRTEIHHRGLHYRAGRLVELVTGRPLSSDALLTHLNRRFRPLYGLA